jgi:hypothetical protein
MSVKHLRRLVEQTGHSHGIIFRRVSPLQLALSSLTQPERDEYSGNVAEKALEKYGEDPNDPDFQKTIKKISAVNALARQLDKLITKNGIRKGFDEARDRNKSNGFCTKFVKLAYVQETFGRSPKDNGYRNVQGVRMPVINWELILALGMTDREFDKAGKPIKQSQMVILGVLTHMVADGQPDKYTNLKKKDVPATGSFEVLGPHASIGAAAGARQTFNTAWSRGAEAKVRGQPRYAGPALGDVDVMCVAGNELREIYEERVVKKKKKIVGTGRYTKRRLDAAGGSVRVQNVGKLLLAFGLLTMAAKRKAIGGVRIPTFSHVLLSVAGGTSNKPMTRLIRKFGFTALPFQYRATTPVALLKARRRGGNRIYEPEPPTHIIPADRFPDKRLFLSRANDDDDGSLVETVFNVIKAIVPPELLRMCPYELGYGVTGCR